MSISVMTYCTELMISRTGTVVSMPHHLPNFDSTPSAAITTSAITLETLPQHSSCAPLRRPSCIIGADARVLTYTSAPASAACHTSSRSKILRSRMYPTFPPAIEDSSVISKPSGATMPAPVISAEIQRGSGSINSARASFPIPSAQRTGAPIAGRFSTTTSSAPSGQTLAQTPQLVQFSSTERYASISSSAPSGQTDTQHPQYPQTSRCTLSILENMLGAGFINLYGQPRARRTAYTRSHDDEVGRGKHNIMFKYYK